MPARAVRPCLALPCLLAVGAALIVAAPAAAAESTPTSAACEPAAEASPETPVCATGETFGGAPADVLLTYPGAVDSAIASECTATTGGGGHERFGGIEAGPAPSTVRLQLAPGAAMPTAIECPISPYAPHAALSALAPTVSLPVAAGPASEGGVVSDPIDPAYLLRMPFGKTSFWLQPWRSYFDTRPASQLLSAVGINFNVTAEQAEATAQLLQESGFTLARMEIPWDAVSYQEPNTFKAKNGVAIRARLTAMQRHGLRPLIVLNANSGGPAPLTGAHLETLAPAPAGSNTVKLSGASVQQVVPGKTGFDYLTWAGAPDILITSVDPITHVATLSRRLPRLLPAGRYEGTTLLYAPFQAPTTRTGTPNPAFTATMAGWLAYVKTVCREVEAITGPGGFDLEIWNELSFGSQFLNSMNYGPPVGASGLAAERKAAITKAVIRSVLGQTVAYVHNPASGIAPGVGVTNGFASETPFPSGADAPLGMTALSKHPYAGARFYPSAYRNNYDRPVNALGVQDTAPGARPPFAPLFVPAYELLNPEYTLLGNSTETIVRDLAPFTTNVYGLPHGRNVGPAGGPPVQKWITEYNLTAPSGAAGLTYADRTHFHAKALLRSLVAMIGKGIGREYFFAAAPGPLSLISSAFFQALEADPAAYPGRQAGGEIMDGFRRMLSAFAGPGTPGGARPLSLVSIEQEGDHAQFAGDGTEAHPSLYDRDVLAVFPFQTAPGEYVIPVYVMTSDILTLYEPSRPATDLQRYDLPDEHFRITLGGLPEGGVPPLVSAYDPLRDATTPARLISRAGSEAVFEIAATDYPRLLRLSFAGP